MKGLEFGLDAEKANIMMDMILNISGTESILSYASREIPDTLVPIIIPYHRILNHASSRLYLSILEFLYELNKAGRQDIQRAKCTIAKTQINSIIMKI